MKLMADASVDFDVINYWSDILYSLDTVEKIGI